MQLGAFLLGTAILGACADEVIDGTGGGATTTSVTTGVGGWTDCSSPNGYEVCGDQTNCDNPDCLCGTAGFGVPGICINESYDAWGGVGVLVGWCKDGGVIRLIGGFPNSCVPEDIGLLYCAQGFQDAIRFADFGTYDCEPLPLPDDCPSPAGIQLCGPSCGACPAGQLCQGRSRLHPYGMCMVPPSNLCSTGATCEAGESCFVYAVDPPGQPFANEYGLCLPDAQCQAAASNLPGGGTCLAP